MDLSIIIVSWNCKEYLRSCLLSLEQFLDGINHEVFVVDNDSNDESDKMVREEFPRTNLIANKTNNGFAFANNQAYAVSSGRYVLFLNPDTQLCDNSFQDWISFMDTNRDVAISGCKLLNTDGTHQPSTRRFPGLWLAFERYTPARYLPLKKWRKKRYRMLNLNPDNPSKVEQVSGAALLARREFFPGDTIFDNDFFIFFEEVDLCLRACKAGKMVYYFPHTQIYHHGGKSRQHMRTEINAINIKSMLHYFRKHSCFLRYMLFIILFKPLFVLQLLFDTVVSYPEHFVKKVIRKISKPTVFEKKTSFIKHNLLAFIFKY